MSLADKQREALLRERGDPVITLEFDVFGDGQVSMWTHFSHGADFLEIKKCLVAVNEHLSNFIRDENMCPFSGKK